MSVLIPRVVVMAFDGEGKAKRRPRPIDMYAVGRWCAVEAKEALIHTDNKKAKLIRKGAEVSVHFYPKPVNLAVFCHFTAEFLGVYSLRRVPPPKSRLAT